MVNTTSNSATLICQQPGEGNRLHYHPKWDEWWLILKGRWKVEIDGEIQFATVGDMILIKSGLWHRITAAGHESAVRLAVSRYDVPHVYKD